jgi:hypothetical protein
MNDLTIIDPDYKDGDGGDCYPPATKIEMMSASNGWAVKVTFADGLEDWQVFGEYEIDKMMAFLDELVRCE